MKSVHLVQVGVGALLMLALTSCSSGEPTEMPDVVGTQLDVAKSDIERAGFDSDVEIVGGGMFGVVDDTNWVVCEQEPAAGEEISDPRLVVDRECASSDVSSPPPPEPTESTEPSAAPVTITDTTVDELLDRLNSVDMGGIQLGEQFRFTGELVASDMWYEGVTGDYTILFKAHDGADDLMVFVDEPDAAGWTDGMRLEMVVENTEVTINGETSDGWLRMVSANPAA